jgi:hypothetical protein
VLIPSLAEKGQDRAVVGIRAGIVIGDALALNGAGIVLLQKGSIAAEKPTGPLPVVLPVAILVFPAARPAQSSAPPSV